MKTLFEYSDRLNSPLEVFDYPVNNCNFPVPAHWHYFVEIIYMIQGSIQTTCDNITYTLEPGDLIIYYPQAIHSLFLTEEQLLEQKESKTPLADFGLRYMVMKFDLNILNITNSYKTNFSKLFKLAFEKNPQNIHFQKETLASLPIKMLIMDSLHEMQCRSYGYDVIICSNISKLLTALIRCLRESGLNTDVILTAPAEKDSAIYSITEYIDAHSNESLQVQELAKQCGMSYSYFAKMFREIYHQSCKEYIEFIRLHKVEDLLLFTDLDLNFISQETGFSDCSHLIRTFKKWKGMTPKHWKQKNRTRADLSA